MNKFLTLLSAVTMVLGTAVLMVGCHTVSGFGQDLQAGGKALSKAADKDDKK